MVVGQQAGPKNLAPVALQQLMVEVIEEPTDVVGQSYAGAVLVNPPKGLFGEMDIAAAVAGSESGAYIIKSELLQPLLVLCCQPRSIVGIQRGAAMGCVADRPTLFFYNEVAGFTLDLVRDQYLRN